MRGEERRRHPYVQSNGNDIGHLDNLSEASDEINPEDSASNVSCQEENLSRGHSKLSKDHPHHLQE